ncbi:MAG: hypothetical protein JWP69_1454 [Flaviaesturariibacter sp.]|nr:hypothetical protein [Flaviaesturariibacter sp.]
MDEAKIQFSPSEMELMCNAGIILTKNRILHNIKSLFEGLEQQLLSKAYFIEDTYLATILEPSAKISRGENYLGLPYIVLDYPRQFDSLNIFTVRSMFWWGHEFSSTLQLAGRYKIEMQPKIEAAYTGLAKRQYYIGVNDDPWQHHFEEENYLPIASMSEEDFCTYCRQNEHLKIAARWYLRDVNFVVEDLGESWQFLMKICSE